MTTEYTPNFGLALPDFRMGPWHDLINNDFRKIDALLYGAMAAGDVAPWQNSTHYIAGVTTLDDTDATVWLCVVDHTSAATPTTFAADRSAHPTYWTRLLTGFAPRGEWKQNTAYFPYDLAYDTGLGIMALCTIKHVSTSTGNILDDQGNWAFLLDMSDIGLIVATAVTWSKLAHPNVNATNVQAAIDFLETQIKAIDAINVTQGTDISSIKLLNTAQDSRLTAIEGVNSSQATAITTINTTLTSHTSSITSLQDQINNFQSFPAGTTMIFAQASPPPGWHLVGWANAALKIVADGSGGTTGGIHIWDTIFTRQEVDHHTLSVSEMPSHNHGGVESIYPGDFYASYVSSPDVSFKSGATNVGGNQGHTHGMDMRLLFVAVSAFRKS